MVAMHSLRRVQTEPGLQAELHQNVEEIPRRFYFEKMQEVAQANFIFDEMKGDFLQKVLTFCKKSAII